MNLLEWELQTQAVISSRLSSISEIINGTTLPTELYENVRGRSTTRSSLVVNCAQGTDVAINEDTESSTARRVINEDGTVLYDRANEQFLDTSYSTTTGPAACYSIRFEQGSTKPGGKKHGTV